MQVALYLGSHAHSYSDRKREGDTFTGLGDKDRFEIDDSGAKLVGMTEPGRDDYFSLASVLNHPELFKEYPGIADLPAQIKIIPGSDPSGTYTDDGKIKVQAGSMREAMDVLTHEIQHAIQHKEGFPRGSNILKSNIHDYANSAGEYEANAAMGRRYRTDWERKMMEPYQSEQVQKDPRDLVYKYNNSPVRW